MSIEDTPYEGRLYREEGALHFCPYSKALRAHNRVPGMPTCVDTDIGLNVIVAKQAFLLGHPWQEDHKVGEHIPFFWDLKQRVPNQVIACEDLVVKHVPAYDNHWYNLLRNRADSYRQQQIEHPLRQPVSRGE